MFSCSAWVGRWAQNSNFLSKHWSSLRVVLKGLKMAAHIRQQRRLRRIIARRPRQFRDHSNPLEDLEPDEVFRRYRFLPDTIMYIFPVLFQKWRVPVPLTSIQKIYMRVCTQEQTQAQSCAQLRTYSESFITSKIFSNSAEHELNLLEYNLELSTKKVL